MSAGIRKWAAYFGIWWLTPLFFGFCTGIVYSSDIIEFIGRLSDCFFASGMMLGGLGILLFAADKGLFDMFGYGIKKLSMARPDEAEAGDYFSYKCRKQKKRTAYSGTLFAGAVFIVISFIGCFLWYLVQ